MSLLRSFTSLIIALALGVSFAAPLIAGGVIPPRGFVRKFPTGQFCALPVSISFTPPASSVIVHFDAQVYLDNAGTLTWTGQSIDNVSVATTAQVVANFGPPTGLDCEDLNQGNCYVDEDGPPQDPPASYFYFNRAGLTLALLELFDTDPAGRGWDLTHGGYFIVPPAVDPTAPRIPETCQDVNGGSLGLGPESTPPSLSETATTSITVNGLSPGTSYDLGAWWNAQFTIAFPATLTLLTVRIETEDGTPIARKSWGGLKSTYR